MPHGDRMHIPLPIWMRTSWCEHKSRSYPFYSFSLSLSLSLSLLCVRVCVRVCVCVCSVHLNKCPAYVKGRSRRRVLSFFLQILIWQRRPRVDTLGEVRLCLHAGSKNGVVTDLFFAGRGEREGRRENGRVQSQLNGPMKRPELCRLK